MEDQKPGYYAIVTNSVLMSEKLSDSAKVLFAHINLLSNNENKVCWANNHYFENVMRCSTSSIVRYMNELIDEGFILRELLYDEDTKQVTRRNLYPVHDTDKIRDLQSKQKTTKVEVHKKESRVIAEDDPWKPWSALTEAFKRGWPKNTNPVRFYQAVNETLAELRQEFTTPESIQKVFSDFKNYTSYQLKANKGEIKFLQAPDTVIRNKEYLKWDLQKQLIKSDTVKAGSSDTDYTDVEEIIKKQQAAKQIKLV